MTPAIQSIQSEPRPRQLPGGVNTNVGNDLEGIDLADGLFKNSHRKVLLLLVGYLLALFLGGCTPRQKNAPSTEQVRDAVSAALPPFLSITDCETESLVTGAEAVQVNFKATVTPKETLYAADRTLPGDPSIMLIKPVQAAGTKKTLYGSLQARRVVDRWTLDTPEFTDDGAAHLGNPRGSFADRSYVTGSPEAAQAIRELNAHAEQLDRERKDREEKERQARQAQADEHQRQEQAARDKLLQATAPGTRYLGTITNPSSARSQRLRLTFGAQNGLGIQVEASNPDRPADRRTFLGEVVLAPQRNDAFTAAQHAYPIQFNALTADGKTASASGQWWFYQRAGPVGLIPTEGGGLTGEAVTGEPYVIRLQKEP